MKIFVNDETLEVLDDSSLASALDSVGVEDGKGWAVAVNREVVPSEAWEETKLNSEDSLLLVRATQGG